MFPLNETLAVQTEFYQVVTKSHQMAIQVEVLDKSENPIDSLTYPESAVLGGNIEVDTSRNGPTRLLTLEVLNADQRWRFDPADPDNSTLWLTHFLKVLYGVYLPDAAKWVWVPVGVYSIDRPKQKGEVLSISGSDKGSRNIDPNKTRRPYSKIKKSWRNVNAIRQILLDHGETRFRMDGTNAHVVGKHLSFPAGSEMWVECLKLASAIHWALFYDGDGVATLRPISTSPVWTYDRNSDDGIMLDDIELDHDIQAIKNHVYVKGGAVRGKVIAATATAPSENPLNPYRLDPNDGLWRPLFYENPYIKKKSQAQNKANALLAEAMQAGTSITFPALVVPTLEEYDYVRVDDPDRGVSQTVILEKFNIPLSHDGQQTIGSSYKAKVRS